MKLRGADRPPVATGGSGAASNSLHLYGVPVKGQVQLLSSRGVLKAVVLSRARVKNHERRFISQIASLDHLFFAAAAHFEVSRLAVKLKTRLSSSFKSGCPDILSQLCRISRRGSCASAKNNRKQQNNRDKFLHAFHRLSDRIIKEYSRVWIFIHLQFCYRY